MPLLLYCLFLFFWAYSRLYFFCKIEAQDAQYFALLLPGANMAPHCAHRTRFCGDNSFMCKSLSSGSTASTNHRHINCSLLFAVFNLCICAHFVSHAIQSPEILLQHSCCIRAAALRRSGADIFFILFLQYVPYLIDKPYLSLG